MALVYRNGRPYRYKSSREGGRVVCRYQGSGETAVLIDQIDAIEREERDSEAERHRDLWRQLDAVDKPVADLSTLVDALVESALTAAGWHRTGRHPWRKRRTPMPPQTPAPADDTPPAAGVPPRLPEAEVRKLMDRAQKGDTSAMPALRKWIDQNVTFKFEDAARGAEEAVARLMYNTDLLSQESVSRQIRATASNLGGPNPSPIEAMLARRAALCWISVNWSESQYANLLREGTTMEKSDHYQRRTDRAHRRLLSSLKALASVRRVPLTAVQVNVQSVNVATP